MNEIRIVIIGEAVAQGRPKFRQQKNFVMTYDPPKSREWKDYARMVAASQMMGSPLKDGPLSLSLCVYRSIPTSWSKKKRGEALAGLIRPTTKPDLDNYLKSVKDAMKGIVWKDDSQVVDYHSPFGKWYSDKPRIEITVKPCEKVQPVLFELPKEEKDGGLPF